jgi:hypothetical protein
LVAKVDPVLVASLADRADREAVASQVDLVAVASLVAVGFLVDRAALAAG